MSEMFREIMRQSKPKLERMPSSTSLNSFKELRRRISVDSMAEESTDGAQDLEYQVTLTTTPTFSHTSTTLSHTSITHLSPPNHHPHPLPYLHHPPLTPTPIPDPYPTHFPHVSFSLL
ncbi:hypothetical protein Pcinc_029176 [Petrolisthes cinctipes]|uniref:Uncharacterized protein n=1 Tax=Petrolisthes cinctipes TaxID=88211 RepID=A0AAE1F1K0_PETCI|nr:hypothetical protein Pcinc_029176 [Petrolisthes cinctipes]